MDKGLNNKSLIGIILIFIVLGISLVVINDIGNRMYSGARAYISGEGEWAKAQKQASLALVQYLQTENEE